MGLRILLLHLIAKIYFLLLPLFVQREVLETPRHNNALPLLTSSLSFYLKIFLNLFCSLTKPLKAVFRTLTIWQLFCASRSFLKHKSDTSSSHSGYSTSTFNHFYSSESKVDRKVFPERHTPTTPLTSERADQDPQGLSSNISPEDVFKRSAASRKTCLCLLDVLRAHGAEAHPPWSWTLGSHHHPAGLSSQTCV